jgi:DNA-binding NarL/FixJ family response regulator
MPSTEPTASAPQSAAKGASDEPFPARTTVVLADDHELMRMALRSLCAQSPGLEVVGEACTGIELVDLARRLAPDIVLTDLIMPEMDGVAAIRLIRVQFPNVKVVVFSAHDDPEFVATVLSEGVSAYVTKDSLSGDLLDALRAVRSGRGYVSPRVAGAVLNDLIGDKHGPGVGAKPKLTAREHDVLQLLAKGKVSKEIATELKVSPSTVDVHRHNLMKKLGIDSVAGLTKYAIRNGIATLE